MKIYLATDHAGFELKEAIKEWLSDKKGVEVYDCGAKVYDEEDDFPDYVAVAAKEVGKNPKESVAIVFGGSGTGEAMLANRFRRVRAALYYGGSLDIVKLSREHNDSNVLSIGARFVKEQEAKKAIDIWLNTEPSPKEKYHRRISKAASF
ncbi:ribose-5-phosphate isomerase [bacterium]|nr:ribose-5-phosphate isomerase [bacterium]|tara:strand:- start:376 stop:825 length:450 start_codon:yes stop_codon:yes gene_type:complete